jgi:hypothetical protein
VKDTRARNQLADAREELADALAYTTRLKGALRAARAEITALRAQLPATQSSLRAARSKPSRWEWRQQCIAEGGYINIYGECNLDYSSYAYPSLPGYGD